MLKYKDLEIGRQNRYRPKIKWSLPVLAFDTETLTNGDIFLLADSLGCYVWRPTLRQCLDFLYKRTHHQKLNFFYNLEFDIRGIIKFLYESEQKKLVTDGKVLVKLPIGGRHYPVNYTVRYCKDRMYVVKNEKKTVAFFDLAQFYRPLSLDRASQIFLKQRKEKIESYDFTLSTIEKRKDEIIKYCLKDCILASKLGTLIKKRYEKLDIYEKVYISPAFLTEKYFNQYCYVPKTLSLIKTKWRGESSPVEYAYNSYKGGWIEIQKRGHFNHLYRYDLNSAYPHVMRNLVDPTLGQWTFSKDWLPGSTYAFVKVQVHIDPLRNEPFSNNVYLSPISYLFISKGTNLRYYPVGEWTTFLTKNEYLFVRDYLGVRNQGLIKLTDGWFFFADPFSPRPLRKRIDLLYQKKNELKPLIKDNPKILIEYNSIKLLLNSLYGKFIQRTEVKKLDLTGNIYIDHARTGNFFNPIWAAVITSEVRLKIIKSLAQKDYSCAAITTDGILTTKPLDLDFGSRLGQWSEEPGGEAVIVLPGAYGIRGQSSENKIRGFAGIFRDKKVKDWFDYLVRHKKDSFIEIIDRRPVSLMEALLHTEKFSRRDINRFVEFNRRYNLKEYRRLWHGEIKNCQDLLKKSVDSSPWEVSKLERLQQSKRKIKIFFGEFDTLIEQVIRKGGIKNTPALRDFGNYSELPLRVRRKGKLPFDEMADELKMTDDELWEGLVYNRGLTKTKAV